MATFDQRRGLDGKTVYRVRVRRKGYATQTALSQSSLKLRNGHRLLKVRYEKVVLSNTRSKAAYPYSTH
jgi:hypothetical protein